MSKYGRVFKLSIQDIFEYRFDFLIHLIKYAAMVMMMAVVWVAVQKESGYQVMTRVETIRYFVFAAVLYSLSNFHTSYIEVDIKLGGLTKYLVKPLQPFAYYYTREGALALFETLLKATVMLPIIGWLGYLPHLEPLRLVLFLLYLPLIFTFAFHQFFLISSLAFWVNEIYAIRWGVTIIFRFLAGTLVPLSFLPLFVQQTLFWSPYPHLAYNPILLIQGSLPITSAIQGLIILVSWIVALHVLVRFVWHKGSHSFESTGI